MYDNQYEEYIRSVLGYPNTTNMNQNQIYQNEYPNPSQVNMRNDLEDFYPEIYKIIYPMVQKACDGNMGPNSREEIERMTDEIYSAIEDSNQINVNINLGNTVSTTNMNRTQNRNEIPKEDLAYYFVEFRPYLGKCEYADCSHIKEEKCAIKQAVQEKKKIT